MGTEIFRKALDDWAPSEVRGWWKESDIYTGGESVNLTSFKKNISDGMSIKEAARQTPSGKIFGSEGYSNVQVLKNEPDEVIIIFKQNG